MNIKEIVKIFLGVTFFLGVIVTSNANASDERDQLAPMRDELSTEELKARTYRRQHAKELEKIRESNRELLATDASKKSLDSYFSHPCQAEGFAADIFEIFKGTQGGRNVCLDAISLLPIEIPILLHVKSFMKMEETNPGVKQGGHEIVTHDNVGKTRHEQILVVDAKEVPAVVQFEFTFNLIEGGRPTCNLVLKDKSKGIPSAVETQARVATISDQPSVLPPEKDSMHVCLFSEGRNIPTSTGPTKALRHVYETTKIGKVIE